MISLEKLAIFTPLQKLPYHVGGLGKTIVATGFEKLPKVQQIAQPGHTDCRMSKCEEQKGANDHHHDDIFHLMEHYLVEGLLVSISNIGIFTFLHKWAIHCPASFSFILFFSHYFTNLNCQL